MGAQGQGGLKLSKSRDRPLYASMLMKKSHEKIINLPFPPGTCGAMLPCELKGSHQKTIYKFNRTLQLSKAPQFSRESIQSFKH